MKSIFESVSELERSQSKGALCTIVHTKGSTPRKEGSKMIVLESGEIKGSIGGGDFEKKVIENAIDVIRKRRPAFYRHDLLNQHGMCCGGSIEIFIEPIMPKHKLYIFGAGHTGHSLAQYAVNFDFEIYLIDDRKDYLDAIKLSGINKMCLPHLEALKALPFDENTFITILTYSHPIDRDILAYCLQKPHAYLGMIGSQRKVKMTEKMFDVGGISNKSQLSNVDMPMGIDIHAESPDEIAISILAKLIQVKNKVVEK